MRSAGMNRFDPVHRQCDRPPVFFDFDGRQIGLPAVDHLAEAVVGLREKGWFGSKLEIAIPVWSLKHYLISFIQNQANGFGNLLHKDRFGNKGLYAKSP